MNDEIVVSRIIPQLRRQGGLDVPELSFESPNPRTSEESAPWLSWELTPDKYNLLGCPVGRARC